MPIPNIIRVNPLDLQKNISIGVSLPFSGPSGPFNSTYSTQEQIKSNLINLLLTNKGERIFNPNFGTYLQKALFEGITDELPNIISNLIIDSTSIYIPEIQITEVITDVLNKDLNTISITVNYKLNISGKPDQVTIQFL